MESFSSTDSATIIIYLALVIGISLYVSRLKKENTENYFLAGRKLSWFAIGASLFVTSISAEHFIALSEGGAKHGLIVGHFEWLAIFAILLTGWIFGPLYLKAGVYTIPEFIERRYNRSSRLYLTGISILVYILTKLSITLFAGGLLLNALLGWDIYTSALVLVVITGLYTVIGGLRAVVYAQMIQLFFLIGGALLITIIGLNEVGGPTGLINKLPASYFNVFRPLSDPHFPWTGIIFGIPILAVWYWCTDQYMVQRILGGRDVKQIKRAVVFTGILNFLPVFLIIIPGMVAAVLFSETSGNEISFIMLAKKYLPFGFTGIFLAALLAAIMSSLASVFHSTATLVTMDFYKIFSPEASNRKQVLIGRLSTTLIVICAILWIPLTKLINSQIYLYLLSVQAYIAPPIAAIFVFGVISKSVNGRGAFLSLIIGGGLGLLRIVMELIQGFYNLQGTFMGWFVELNFLHFAIALFLISTGILYGVSIIYQESGELKPVQSQEERVRGRVAAQSFLNKNIKQGI